MATFFYDVRMALRALLLRPALTLPIVLTLALGIGLSSAMVLVIDGVLLRPLPYPSADRLLRISDRTAHDASIATSYLNFSDWRSRADLFDGMAAVAQRNTTILGGKEPVRAPALFVSADYFKVAGTQPFLGRAIAADENREGAAPVAVVGYDFWRETLGSPRTLENVTLTMSDMIGRSEVYRVIGVMPQGFDLMAPAAVYLPLDRGVPWNVRNHAVDVIARVKPGVQIEAATAQLQTIHRAMRAQHPDIDAIDVAVQPLADEILGPVRRPLVMLMGGAGLLLLIAFSNVAGALLARGISRQQEMVIRTALGASRARLIGQLVIESLLLAVGSAIFAALIARGLFDAFGNVDPSIIPRLQQIAPNWILLVLVAAVLASFGVLLFGVGSALLTSRWASASLRVRGGGAQRGQRAVWRTLLGGEIALAFMLLVATGLLGRSLYRIASVDTGFDAHNVATIDVSLPGAKYPEAADYVRYFDTALGTLRALPGVSAAGVNIMLPVPNSGGIGGPLQVENGDAKDVIAQYRAADDGYFNALAIPLVRGRLIDARDRDGTPHSAVVNEALARRLWGTANPIGKRFRIPGMDGFDQWITVVGVVADAHAWNVDAGKQLMYYVSWRQRPTFLAVAGATIVVHGSNAPIAAATLRSALSAIDPNVPLRLNTLEARLGKSTADKRFIVAILGIFAVLALIMSGVGIWGVSSFVVSRRVREMGIRLAIGAAPAQVRRMLQVEAFIPLVAGLAVGLFLAVGVTRWIQSMLFGVTKNDVVTFAAAAATLAVTTWMASFLPAWKTARIDPSTTLRNE